MPIVSIMMSLICITGIKSLATNSMKSFERLKRMTLFVHNIYQQQISVYKFLTMGGYKSNDVRNSPSWWGMRTEDGVWNAPWSWGWFWWVVMLMTWYDKAARIRGILFALLALLWWESHCTTLMKNCPVNICKMVGYCSLPKKSSTIGFVPAHKSISWTLDPSIN